MLNAPYPHPTSNTDFTPSRLTVSSRVLEPKSTLSLEKTENIEQENNTASIMIPQKVRVLLSQDHGQNPERQSVCLTGNSMWKLSGNTGETEQFFAANEVSDCGVWMKAHGVSEVTAEAVDDGKLYVDLVQGGLVDNEELMEEPAGEDD